MNAQFESHQKPIQLYRNPKSDHCHRVELMLSLLDIPYDAIDMDMANGAHKAEGYLKISPFGQVPAINDNGLTLSDSNGINTYLATRYGDTGEWLGHTAVEKAQIQQWLSVSAGEIASGPAAARLVSVFGAKLDQPAAQAKAHKLLTINSGSLSHVN